MLEFIVTTSAGVFRQVAVPKRAHVELLWNQVSFAELTFDDDDKVWADLKPGARVRILFDDVQVMAGPLVKRAGAGPIGDVTATIEDDFRLFRNLGWQKPSAAIGSQTDEYKRYTGPTETVVKAAAADLSARLGLGWTIPATTGLGSAQRVEFRMHPLVDKLVPLLDADRLTWSITNKTVDVTAGSLFPRILTAESGVLADYTWSETAPEVTRVIVGGEGEGTARLFQRYIDAPRESTWGFIAEVFRDSRMAQGITDLSPDAAETLAEGAPRVTIAGELNETAFFRFGTYHVGDRVRVQVDGLDVTEPIRSVVIDDSPDNGLTVVPSIGSLEYTADTALGAHVSALAQSVRDQRTR